METFQYFELYNNLEKTVIEFLSLDKSEEERRLQLVEEHMTPVGVILALESLFSDGGLVQTKLKWNKYSDEAFNLIYRLTKNHAILIVSINGESMAGHQIRASKAHSRGKRGGLAVFWCKRL